MTTFNQETFVTQRQGNHNVHRLNIKFAHCNDLNHKEFILQGIEVNRIANNDRSDRNSHDIMGTPTYFVSEENESLLLNGTFADGEIWLNNKEKYFDADFPIYTYISKAPPNDFYDYLSARIVILPSSEGFTPDFMKVENKYNHHVMSNKARLRLALLVNDIRTMEYFASFLNIKDQVPYLGMPTNDLIKLRQYICKDRNVSLDDLKKRMFTIPNDLEFQYLVTAESGQVVDSDSRSLELYNSKDEGRPLYGKTYLLFPSNYITVREKLKDNPFLSSNVSVDDRYKMNEFGEMFLTKSGHLINSFNTPKSYLFDSYQLLISALSNNNIRKVALNEDNVAGILINHVRSDIDAKWLTEDLNYFAVIKDEEGKVTGIESSSYEAILGSSGEIYAIDASNECVINLITVKGSEVEDEQNEKALKEFISETCTWLNLGIDDDCVVSLQITKEEARKLGLLEKSN